MSKRQVKGRPQGATKQPATKQPATKQPATKQPATKQPATKQPSKKPRQRRRPVLSDSLRVTNEHAAGIDIHQREHWVAVPPGSAAPTAPKDDSASLPAHVRRFGTNTADLEELADWLAACGVTTVAME